MKDTVFEWVRVGVLLVADVLGWILHAIWTALEWIAYAVWTVIAFLGKWAWWGIVEFLAILKSLTAGTWFGWYVFELPMFVPIVTFWFASCFVLGIFLAIRNEIKGDRHAKLQAETIDHNLLRAKMVAARLTQLPAGDKHLNYVFTLYDWRAIDLFLTNYDSMGEEVFVERLNVSDLESIENILRAAENLIEEGKGVESRPQQFAQGFEIPTSVKVAGAAAGAYGGFKLGRKIANWLTR